MSTINTETNPKNKPKPKVVVEPKPEEEEEEEESDAYIPSDEEEGASSSESDEGETEEVEEEKDILSNPINIPINENPSSDEEEDGSEEEEEEVDTSVIVSKFKPKPKPIVAKSKSKPKKPEPEPEQESKEDIVMTLSPISVTDPTKLGFDSKWSKTEKKSMTVDKTTIKITRVSYICNYPVYIHPLKRYRTINSKTMSEKTIQEIKVEKARWEELCSVDMFTTLYCFDTETGTLSYRVVLFDFEYNARDWTCELTEQVLSKTIGSGKDLIQKAILNKNQGLKFPSSEGPARHSLLLPETLYKKLVKIGEAVKKKEEHAAIAHSSTHVKKGVLFKEEEEKEQKQTPTTTKVKSILKPTKKETITNCTRVAALIETALVKFGSEEQIQRALSEFHSRFLQQFNQPEEKKSILLDKEIIQCLHDYIVCNNRGYELQTEKFIKIGTDPLLSLKQGKEEYPSPFIDFSKVKGKAKATVVQSTIKLKQKKKPSTTTTTTTTSHQQQQGITCSSSVSSASLVDMDSMIF